MTNSTVIKKRKRSKKKNILKKKKQLEFMLLLKGFIENSVQNFKLENDIDPTEIWVSNTDVEKYKSISENGIIQGLSIVGSPLIKNDGFILK